MITSLLGKRLRTSKVGEKVAELLITEAFEQTLWHQTAARGLEGLDLILSQNGVLIVRPSQHEDLGISIFNEACQGAAVLCLDLDRCVAFPDLAIRTQDAEEHRTEIVSLVSGQVWADATPFVK